MRKLLPALALLLALPAGATTRYADASCANNGNGTSASCAGSPGGAGAYSNVSGCLAGMSSGDTCQVAYSATAYVGFFNFCGDASHNLNGPGTLTCSVGGASCGSEGATCNTTGVCTRNYTTFVGIASGSSKPKLCFDSGCSNTVVAHANVSLGSYFHNAPVSPRRACNWVKLDGFEIHGGLEVWNNDGATAPTTNIRITNNDVTGSGSSDWCDGNASIVRMEDNQKTLNVNNITFDHNRVHDLADCGQGAVGAYGLVKLYNVNASLFEYNTIDASTGHSTGNGLIDDKDTPRDNVFRYNHLIGSGNDFAFRIAMQHSLSSYQQGGDEVYGNVMVNGGLNLLEGTSTDRPWNFHHNTFIGSGNGAFSFIASSPNVGLANVTIKDNIVQGTGTTVSINCYQWNALSTMVLDYNRYGLSGSAAFRHGCYSQCVGTGYTSLANWITELRNNAVSCGSGGCACTSTGTSSTAEANSTSIASANACTWTTGPDGLAYHPTDNACLTGSSTTGQLGAYGAPGATGCVGWTCSAAAPPTTVPIVTGVRLSNVKVTP